MKTQNSICLEIRPYNRAKLFLGGSADDVETVADCDSPQSAEMILRAVNEHAALVAVAEAAEATLAPYRQAIYGTPSVSAQHKLSVALANLAAVRGQK